MLIERPNIQGELVDDVEEKKMIVKLKSLRKQEAGKQDRTSNVQKSEHVGGYRCTWVCKREVEGKGRSNVTLNSFSMTCVVQVPARERCWRFQDRGKGIK